MLRKSCVVKLTEENEDLNVKVYTKEYTFWKKVKEETELLLEQTRNSIILNTEVLAVAEKKLAEEEEKTVKA